jgi:1-acyl-sn-glycerol-3-phosphate acyltransferase
MTKIQTKLAGKTRTDRVVYFVVRNLLLIFLKVWCRLRVEGREHLPKHALYVLAPTHRSIIDTPVASGVANRRLRFLGADKWWSNEHFGRLLTALGGFPVTRGTADREALMRCIGVVEGGEPLVLFPEGERKSGPIVQPLLDGAVYIAMKTGVPIVPVGIGGSEKAMPKGARFIRPHKIVAIIGEPIRPPVDESGRVLRLARRDVTAQLHDELQRLYDLAQIRADG